MLMMKFSPSPVNINYMWNFGSLLIFMLILQIISGLFLSFHYNSFMDMAFFSTVHISRDVNFGWLIRLFHINGASMFFFLIFFHIVKGLVNSSWKFLYVWNSGLVILLLSMMTAFMGYVLPWGQMSFWAATVITNLLSAIPMIGKILVEWIWGGFSVSYPTLSRFFSFHFILPLVIFMIVAIHIIFLHLNGSSNPISMNLNLDKISFDPFFSVKDIIGLIFVMMLFLLLMFLNPFYSVDAENFIEANSMVTPIHIKPEWYFLFAYAILRAVPNKIGGVMALFSSLLIFLVKPFQKILFNMKFNYVKKLLLMLFFYNFMILTFLGGESIDFPYDTMSIIFSISYFILFLNL